LSAATLWLRGFALTIAVEEAIAVPLLAPVESSKLRRAMAVLIVNLATHPLVWFFFTHLGWPRWGVVLGAEAWAFGFEIVAYRSIFSNATWRRCTAVSVAANLGSYLLGNVAMAWGLYQ
jgi:hypothetical protein